MEKDGEEYSLKLRALEKKVVAKQGTKRTSMRIPNDERMSSFFSHMEMGSKTCSIIQSKVKIHITDRSFPMNSIPLTCKQNVWG